MTFMIRIEIFPPPNFRRPARGNGDAEPLTTVAHCCGLQRFELLSGPQRQRRRALPARNRLPNTAPAQSDSGTTKFSDGL